MESQLQAEVRRCAGPNLSELWKNKGKTRHALRQQPGSRQCFAVPAGPRAVLHAALGGSGQALVSPQQGPVLPGHSSEHTEPTRPTSTFSSSIQTGAQGGQCPAPGKGSPSGSGASAWAAPGRQGPRQEGNREPWLPRQPLSPSGWSSRSLLAVTTPEQPPPTVLGFPCLTSEMSLTRPRS